MHEHSFPESAESPDARTARAVEALTYEDAAGLGFRRRIRGAMGNPYAEPERFQIDRELTAGELWAGYLAGIGIVLGSFALLYKPLLLGFIAAICTVIASVADGPSQRTSRLALWIVPTCVTLGMLISIFVTKKAIW